MTLQDQYTQINEGKGAKDVFLKHAKKLFPNMIPNHYGYEDSVKILKQRSVITENIWGIANASNKQPDWFQIFNENLNEYDKASNWDNESINEENKSLPIIKSVTYFGGGNYTVTLDDGYKILISGGNLEGIYGGDAEDVKSFVGQEWDQEPYNINEAKKAKTDPKDKKKADKTNYGQKDIADIDMVNPYELKKGIRIEMVDTEDYVKAMDKAVKKLKKDPMFYSNLIANAKHVKADKRSDLPKEVKDKKLNKTSDKMKDKANEMEVSKKDATKKNAKDTLNKKEMAKGKPKGVKEMTMKPKSSKGMKAMDTPGKETKAKLKESISIFNSLKKLLLS